MNFHGQAPYMYLTFYQSIDSEMHALLLGHILTLNVKLSFRSKRLSHVTWSSPLDYLRYTHHIRTFG